MGPVIAKSSSGPTKQMLGATLVTVQTGPHGKQVNRLYIEDGSDIDKEFYLSILVNRETSEVSFVVSTEGGVNIEEVAHALHVSGFANEFVRIEFAPIYINGSSQSDDAILYCGLHIAELILLRKFPRDSFLNLTVVAGRGHGFGE